MAATSPEMESIPKSQRAFVLSSPGGDLAFNVNHPVVQPSELLPEQCLVKLSHSGVCHTDLAIRLNHLPASSKENLVGGHEGVGVVVAIGAHTQYDGVKIGDRVGVKLIANVCLCCEMCLKGIEGLCSKVQSSGIRIDGTFCEYTVAYVKHVVHIPDRLDSPSAAAIMCAGVSAYSALQQCNAHAGDWVVVSGAGGGLGHLAIQYALTMGFRVIAIDTGGEKRVLCKSLGAEAWIDFVESNNVVTDVLTITGGAGAHVAIVTAGGNEAYTAAAMFLRPSGQLMAVGIPPNAPLSLSMLLVIRRGLSIRGIFVGNRQQTIEAINLAALGKVKCHYSIRGLSELESVYEDLGSSSITGRVILDIAK